MLPDVETALSCLRWVPYTGKVLVQGPYCVRVRTNHLSEMHKQKLMGPYENVRAHLET